MDANHQSSYDFELYCSLARLPTQGFEVNAGFSGDFGIAYKVPDVFSNTYQAYTGFLSTRNDSGQHTFSRSNSTDGLRLGCGLSMVWLRSIDKGNGITCFVLRHEELEDYTEWMLPLGVHGPLAGLTASSPCRKGQLFRTGQFLLYLAEASTSQVPHVWENKAPESDPSKPRVDRYDYAASVESYFEQMTETKNPIPFIIDLCTRTIYKIPGIPSGMSIKEAVFTEVSPMSDMQTRITVVAAALNVNRSRRYGMVFCTNRPTTLLKIEFILKDETKGNPLVGKMGEAHLVSVSCLTKSSQDNLCGDGIELKYLWTQPECISDIVPYWDDDNRASKMLLVIYDSPVGVVPVTHSNRAHLFFYDLSSHALALVTDEPMYPRGAPIGHLNPTRQCPLLFIPSHDSQSFIVHCFDVSNYSLRFTVRDCVYITHNRMTNIGVFATSGATQPLEFQLRKLDDGKEVKLCTTGRIVQDDFDLYRQVSIESGPGLASWALVKSKERADGPIRVGIIVHGGPNSVVLPQWIPKAWFLILSMDLDAMIFPNYPGSSGGSEADILGKVGEDDVDYCADVYKKFLRDNFNVDDAFFTNNTSSFVFGGSHGGFIGAHLMSRYPGLFKAAVLLNPVIDFPAMKITSDIPDIIENEVLKTSGAAKLSSSDLIKKLFERSPLSSVDKVIGSTCLLIGAKDLRVPPSQGRSYYYALKGFGKDVEMYMYPDADHSLAEAEPACHSSLKAAEFLRSRLNFPKNSFRTSAVVVPNVYF